ncbi:hypothetical protein ACVXG9_05330 [Escherichia coli]
MIAGLVSGQAMAAPESPPHADIRDSGFVYCVSGQVNTFNPSKASSGLIVDTLAAQFLIDCWMSIPILSPDAGTCRKLGSTRQQRDLSLPPASRCSVSNSTVYSHS